MLARNQDLNEDASYSNYLHRDWLFFIRSVAQAPVAPFTNMV